jgi:hypothetical protein
MPVTAREGSFLLSPPCKGGVFFTCPSLEGRGLLYFPLPGREGPGWVPLARQDRKIISSSRDGFLHLNRLIFKGEKTWE